MLKIVRENLRLHWRKILAGGFAAGLLFLLHKPGLLESYSFSRTVTDRNGEVLRVTTSADEKYRVFTKLEDFSSVFVDAVLLKEDKHFFKHPGVNPWSVIRAAGASYFTAGTRVGASTITMQLARLRFGLRTRSIPGKLWQMFRAIQLELHYSKREILEAYLNLAPYGYNVEGAGAASLIFFHKDASKLTLPESISLAVLPQNPSRRRFANGLGASESLLLAQKRLFAEWLQAHPSDEKFAGLVSLPVSTFGREDLRFAVPHLTSRLLRERPSELRIRTTIDLEMQAAVEGVLRRTLQSMRNIGVMNASAMLLDAPSMEVLASVGSVNFFDPLISGQVDGTRMKRSPGSALKPFIYALAFEQGLIHPYSMLADTPVSYGAYDPENFDRKFLGPVTAKDALRLSRNVPAMRIATQLKGPTFYEFLTRADISKLREESEYGLSLILGGVEVSMRELIELYAMLANGGLKRPAQFVLDESQPGEATQLLSPEASFLTLEALKSTPRPEIRVGGPEVYWKTGTSNGYRDAWTAGVFGRYVLVVWIGDFTGASNPAYVGIQTAAPLFFSIVHAISSGAKEDLVEKLRISSKVKRVDVCAPTGDLYDELCPIKVKSWFIPGVSPITKQDVYRRVLINKDSGLRACRFEEGVTEWKVFEFWRSDLHEAFVRTGIRKPEIPGAEPECESSDEEFSSHPPRITSPQSSIQYQLRLSGGEHERIPFLAVADADVKSLHWFLGKKYLGQTSAHEPLQWVPVPGTHIVRVVDDHGRADSAKIDVGLVP